MTDDTKKAPVETIEPAIGPNPDGLADQARSAGDRPDEEAAPDPAAIARRRSTRKTRRAP